MSAAPDLLQAERFLTLLAEDELVTFQTFDDSKLKRRELARILHGTLAEHGAELLRLNTAGAGVFFTVNETNLKGREATDIIRVRALFADLDGAPLESVLACGLEPHVIIESSPGRWHAYWLVRGLALSQFTDVQKAIIAKFNSDVKVHDLSRVMRLPGFFHKKGAPFLTHIVSENATLPYSAEQILAEFPPAGGVTTKTAPKLGDNDVLTALKERGLYKRDLRHGGHDITCPWFAEHTGGIDSGTAYWEPNTGGYQGHGFICQHSHCDGKSAQDLRRYLDLVPAVVETFRCTDVGNAQRLVARHGADMRYVVEAKQFIIWRNGRWEWDDDGEAMRRAKDAARSIDDEVRAAPDERRPALRAWATKSEGHDRLRSMIALAQSEHGVPIHVSELDRDPFLLGVRNGVVNLRSGGLRVPRREDLITKLAPVEYHPDATCPTFDCFLERILPSASVRAFVQRLAGYMLTGDISEQCFVTAYGTGANGKSTFVEAMHAMLGDYAMKTEMATLLHKDQDNVRNDLARLRGARLVSSVEIARSRRLNEQLIKELTGGDRITARFLFKEFFEFTPEFKLFIAVNHKPEVHGTDEAIWRRVMLVPFEQYIPPDERDKQLLHKLRTEMPGVLNWALAGCMEWQRGGLQPPEEVIAATQEYREEQDLLSNFLVSWTVIDAKAKASAGELHRAYVLWCRDNGEQAVKQKTFGMTLRERGLRAVNQRWAGKVQRVYDGIGLLEERQKELADRALERGRDKDEAQF
jgi:putative DNA primase/helicase